MSTNSSSELEVADTPETPDTTGAYPRLNDEQILLLSQHGERKVLAKGSTLFCAGDRDCGVFVGCGPSDYHQRSQAQRLSAQGFTGAATSITRSSSSRR